MADMCFARKKTSGAISISVSLIVKMRFFSWSDCDAIGRDFLCGSLAARIPELHRPELEIYRFKVIYSTISTPPPSSILFLVSPYSILLHHSFFFQLCTFCSSSVAVKGLSVQLLFQKFFTLHFLSFYSYYHSVKMQREASMQEREKMCQTVV